MSYFIRQVDTKDPEIAEIIVRMQLECLPSDRPESVKHGYWWICYTSSGVPVGFCGMRASVRWQETGYLSRSGVLEAHQGNGLQKKMIRARMSKARRLGWKWLISDTSDNPASANSLIACGFKMYEPRDPYGLRSSVYWRRRL